VAVPGRRAVKKLPLPFAEGRLTQHGKEPIIEGAQVLIGRFAGASAKMRRDAFQLALELPLMEESQARREERDYSGGFVDLWRKRRGGPRLVVVLQKAGQLVLVVEAGAEMFTHRLGVALAETVIQSFVVCVVKALLVQCPFEIPIDLGHESKA